MYCNYQCFSKNVKIINSRKAKSKGHKPNKIWVHKGNKIPKRSMKLWLQKNDIEMYSAHKEGKSVVPERSIMTLKNKVYKYMTSISKNVYIDNLDDTVNKYNNKYQHN